jgi:hypothetical protein
LYHQPPYLSPTTQLPQLAKSLSTSIVVNCMPLWYAMLSSEMKLILDQNLWLVVQCMCWC